ncbi:MAG: hypothetical protein ACM3ZT_00935 [Bacillota bacterium]
MPWKLEVTDKNKLLKVKYQGDFAADELRATTLKIVAALIEKGSLRLLLDCYDAHFDVPTVAVYQLPELYDQMGVSRQVHAAVVLPKDGYRKEIFEFYEDVCRNRGYFVQLFPDATSALAWLRDPNI